MEGCSSFNTMDGEAGGIEIVPATSIDCGTVGDGVYTLVRTDATTDWPGDNVGNNNNGAVDLALQIINDLAGAGCTQGSDYDLILFALPDGMGLGGGNPVGTIWESYAEAGQFWSIYNENQNGESFLSYPIHTMRAVGQNFGFPTTTSQVGAMGPSPYEEDFARCYNPAYSWLTGWYDNFLLEYTAPASVCLQGVGNFATDKPVTANDEYIAVRITDMNNELYYYIGYNHQVDWQANTGQDINQVVIYETPIQDSPVPVGTGALETTTLVDSLSDSESWMLGSLGITVTVDTIDITNPGDGACITINAMPTAMPTGAPTTMPTGEQTACISRSTKSPGKGKGMKMRKTTKTAAPTGCLETKSPGKGKGKMRRRKGRKQ